MVEDDAGRSILGLERGTRGSAVGDFDGDGAPDLVLSYIDARAGLGINHLDETRQNARLCVRLLGPETHAPDSKAPRTPRDGNGARVIALLPPAPGQREGALLGEVRTAEGYQSSSSPWVYFGLGARDKHAGLRILWPSGQSEEIPAGAANRRLWIREGAGVIREEEL